MAVVVQPLGEIVVSFAVVLGALLVLARLLLLIPLRGPAPGPKGRLALGIGGPFFGIASAAVLTFAVAWHRGGEDFPRSGAMERDMIALGVLLGLVGAFLTANWLRVRLRVSVLATTAAGDQSSTQAVHVAALVGDLGARPGRGIEMTRGSDVTELAGAIAEMPGSKWAGAILGALRTVFALTPWRVLVDEVTVGDQDGESAAIFVIVTWNGSQVASAAVDRRTLNLTRAELSACGAHGTSVDMYRFVAATVLTALASKYPKDFQGLGGAREWRSLGYHYVATTDLRERTAAQRHYLARAVDLDPGNWLAQLALRQVMHRHATDPETIRTYRLWLTHLLEGSERSQFEPITGEPEPVLRINTSYEPLRLRALYTRAALAVNEDYARRPQSRRCRDHAPKFSESTREDVRLLIQELNGAIDDDDCRTIALQLWVAADTLQRVVDAWSGPIGPLVAPDRSPKAGRPGLSETGIALGPSAHYARACLWASRPGPRDSKDRDWKHASDSLLIAAQIPSLREWMKVDPQLADYRRRPEYQALLKDLKHNDPLPAS